MICTIWSLHIQIIKLLNRIIYLFIYLTNGYGSFVFIFGYKVDFRTINIFNI